MTRNVPWYVMTLAAFLIGAYALTVALSPPGESGVVAAMFETSPAGALAHFLGGAVVIIAGALQFNSGIRSRYATLHRWLGRLYVTGILIGGSAGFYMALHSSGGIVAHYGFALLAVCWLGTTAVAYLQIRRGNVQVHRAWMIRSYSLTLAAVTLRIYIPLFLIAGFPFEEAYPVIAWLCWVPNILVAEWLFVARPRFAPHPAG
ncbi:MAG: DUF2306 domain-containing protein [Pseudomonadales bacterium]|nr:DUF2306 domain-containing protein [Pseudomonadales bacterium]